MTKKKVSNSAFHSVRLPQVRKDRDYDYVFVNKKKIMLGRSGTPEARTAYVELQAKLLADPNLSTLKPCQVLVDTLCLAYLEYAEKNDQSHFHGIRTAVKIFLDTFTGQAVESFDSRSFLLLQEKFVEHGVSRQYCNMLLGYVRAMLKWGVIRKLVSHQVHGEAKLVPPLRKGKTRAPEKSKRQDVPDEVVVRSLPHFLPTLHDMVFVQHKATMRPSETFRMKVGEIDTKYTTPDGHVVWMYTPGTNKNTWREKYKAGEYVRIIPLGKPEQKILAPRLAGKSDADYVFCPKDTMRERFERAAAKRKTKVLPSHVRRKEQNARNPKRQDRDCYDRNSYNRAIKRAIIAANKRLPVGEQIPMWTPYQLRHAAITKIVLQTGKLDVARAVAGQKSISVTQGYNHADVLIAVEQAVERSKDVD